MISLQQLFFRLLTLSCGHALPEPDVAQLMTANFVGIPTCSSCHQPVQFLPRFRREMNFRKSKVVEVFDKYFAMKTNLATAKKNLLGQIDGQILQF
jgi:hypothetical protein